MDNLNEPFLIGVWLESLFYGINLVLSSACLFLLTREKRAVGIILLPVIQFLLCSVSVSLALRIIIVAFIERSGNAAIAYLSDFSSPLLVTKVVTISVNSTITDGVLVWRVYCVWGKSWRVAAFPIVMLIASSATVIGQAQAFARYGRLQNVYMSVLARWNYSIFIISTISTVVNTGLIVYGIWSRIKYSRGGPIKYWRLVALVVESGLIYLLVQIICLCLYTTGHSSFVIVYEVFAQLTSIIPTIILIFVGLRSTVADEWVATHHRDTSLPDSQHLRTISASTVTRPFCFEDAPSCDIELPFKVPLYQDQKDH